MIGFISQEDWEMQYPIVILDRAELQHYVGVAGVDRLTDADMQDIAQTMQEELHEMDFWGKLAFVARSKIAEKISHTG